MSTRIERRRRRSNNTQRALSLQLEHTRRLGGIDALVLAMDNGLVVASAGDSSLCEELGAAAPLMDRALFDGALFPELCDEDVEVHSMGHDGTTFLLASVGGGKKRDAWLRRSVNGLQRILTLH